MRFSEDIGLSECYTASFWEIGSYKKNKNKNKTPNFLKRTSTNQAIVSNFQLNYWINQNMISLIYLKKNIFSSKERHYCSFFTTVLISDVEGILSDI